MTGEWVRIALVAVVILLAGVGLAAIVKGAAAARAERRSSPVAPPVAVEYQGVTVDVAAIRRQAALAERQRAAEDARVAQLLVEPDWTDVRATQGHPSNVGCLRPGDRFRFVPTGDDWFPQDDPWLVEAVTHDVSGWLYGPGPMSRATLRGHNGARWQGDVSSARPITAHERPPVQPIGGPCADPSCSRPACEFADTPEDHRAALDRLAASVRASGWIVVDIPACKGCR